MNIMNRTTREEFVMQAIYKQLDLAQIDHSVLKTDKDNWFSNNSITKEKHEEWKLWFISEVKRIFKLNKKLAIKEFNYFDLSYGLRVE